jgi:hypothetical protein
VQQSRHGRRGASRPIPLGRVLAGLVLAATALTGCASGEEPAADGPPRRVGGPTPTPVSQPDEPMDHLEEPIAERLAVRVRQEGMSLEYVDCPRWSGAAPAELVCTAYVDGVVGEVDVSLTRGTSGAVEYDAWLRRGVLVTSRLVARLEAEGFTSVDCGEVPAYPSRVGLRLVCQVQEAGERSYVIATVTAGDGEVEIRDH